MWKAAKQYKSAVLFRTGDCGVSWEPIKSFGPEAEVIKKASPNYFPTPDQHLLQRIKCAGGITNRHHLDSKTYDNSIIASEFVTWMVEEKMAQTRDEAIAKGNSFLRKRDFEHADPKDTSKFADNKAIFIVHGETITEELNVVLWCHIPPFDEHNQYKLVETMASTDTIGQLLKSAVKTAKSNKMLRAVIGNAHRSQFIITLPTKNGGKHVPLSSSKLITSVSKDHSPVFWLVQSKGIAIPDLEDYQGIGADVSVTIGNSLPRPATIKGPASDGCYPLTFNDSEDTEVDLIPKQYISGPSPLWKPSARLSNSQNRNYTPSVSPSSSRSHSHSRTRENSLRSSLATGFRSRIGRTPSHSPNPLHSNPHHSKPRTEYEEKNSCRPRACSKSKNKNHLDVEIDIQSKTRSRKGSFKSPRLRSPGVARMRSSSQSNEKLIKTGMVVTKVECGNHKQVKLWIGKDTDTWKLYCGKKKIEVKKMGW